ncbi:MAG: circadian clock protein KaiC [Gammaproteobacteria bacterium]|nr:circadian clock protein KaiC [Gammaproteobacteria bacterium]
MPEIPLHSPLSKAATGIAGLDGITGGGLPRGRTTLLEGAPGCGKTVLALQSLVHGARHDGEPGLFVAFEESPERLMANAAGFSWAMDELTEDKLLFLDARVDPDLITSGDFDLSGLLAMVQAHMQRSGVRRVVFDALDAVLSLMEDPAAVKREVHRLHNWVLAHGLTTVITAKVDRNEDGAPHGQLDFLQYMVDCSIRLRHSIRQGVSQRSIRVAKYRGTAFEENEAPLLIGPAGLEVAYVSGHAGPPGGVSSERLSSGIEDLDVMFGGGYFRGAGILLTGAPGTAKTTLCGAFAKASCQRGDATLFASFDSRPEEVIRNLRSVNVDLGPELDSGQLEFYAARAISGNAEFHLMRIRALAEAGQVRCLVVDPVSALAKQGNSEVAHGVAERLVDWCKGRGITVLFTSLLDHAHPEAVSTPLHISTIADTWINLSYLVQGGERNRALSIIKSRGTHHSNQVRELLLENTVVRLSEVYSAGGEVLMGTLRWERERSERLAAMQKERQYDAAQRRLRAHILSLEAQVQALHSELEMAQSEAAELSSEQADQNQESTAARIDRRVMRGSKPDGQGA